MPVIQNQNSQGVKPTDLPRLAAGEARSVNDADAKKYLAVDGVVKLTGDEADSALAGSGTTSPDKTGDMVVNESIAEHAAQTGAFIAAPNQVVVGDDEAPLGPPTGVRSTKRTEAEKDLAHRLAFADHEALGKVEVGAEETPHGVPTSQVIHNEQADAQATADELAGELVEVYADPEDKGAEDVEPEPEAEEPPAETEGNKA